VTFCDGVRDADMSAAFLHRPQKSRTILPVPISIERGSFQGPWGASLMAAVKENSFRCWQEKWKEASLSNHY
jgi:hypothetical protein